MKCALGQQSSSAIVIRPRSSMPWTAAVSFGRPLFGARRPALDEEALVDAGGLPEPGYELAANHLALRAAQLEVVIGHFGSAAGLPFRVATISRSRRWRVLHWRGAAAIFGLPRVMAGERLPAGKGGGYHVRKVAGLPLPPLSGLTCHPCSTLRSGPRRTAAAREWSRWTGTGANAMMIQLALHWVDDDGEPILSVDDDVRRRVAEEALELIPDAVIAIHQYWRAQFMMSKPVTTSQ